MEFIGIKIKIHIVQTVKFQLQDITNIKKDGVIIANRVDKSLR